MATSARSVAFTAFTVLASLDALTVLTVVDGLGVAARASLREGAISVSGGRGFWLADGFEQAKRSPRLNVSERRVIDSVSHAAGLVADSGSAQLHELGLDAPRRESTSEDEACSTLGAYSHEDVGEVVDTGSQIT